VYDYFNKWSQDDTWERINGVLVRRVRQAEGRDPEPCAAIIDSQLVKKGRTWLRRSQESERAQTASALDLERVQRCHPRLRLIWADAGYNVA
jgi:transposase